MKNGYWVLIVTVVLIIGIFSLAPVSAAGQAARKEAAAPRAAAGPLPRTPDGRPDLGGYWNLPPGHAFCIEGTTLRLHTCSGKLRGRLWRNQFQ